MNQHEIPRMKLEEIGTDDHIDLFKIEAGHVITIFDGVNVWHLCRIHYSTMGRLWLKGVMMYGSSMGAVKMQHPADMCVDRYIKLNQPFYYGDHHSRRHTGTNPVQEIFIDGHPMLKA